MSSTTLQHLQYIEHEPAKGLLCLAATKAFQESILEHETISACPMLKKNLIQQQRRHGSDNIIQTLITTMNMSPIKKYRLLNYGPSSRLVFDRLAGEPGSFTTDNWSRPTTVTCIHQPISNIVAVCGQTPMSGGKHYASFTFYNTRHESNESVIYNIGVMRSLSDHIWYGNVFGTNERLALVEMCSLWDNMCIDHMDGDRYIGPNSWGGDIDCCMIRPRGLNAPWRARVRAHARDMGPRTIYGSWKQSRKPVRTNLHRSYTIDDPTSNHEEVGLLLDLDKGTLSFYRSGVYEFTIASGLKGEYVWVVEIASHQCLSHSKDHPVYFECRKMQPT